MVQHKVEWCDHCYDAIVICGKCGNNCCNGGYGILDNGSECDACESAYEYQDSFAGRSVSKEVRRDHDDALLRAGLTVPKSNGFFSSLDVTRGEIITPRAFCNDKMKKAYLRQEKEGK